MKIKIDKKTVELKFGFGFLRKFGEQYQKTAYQDTINLITTSFSSFDDLTFQQEDMFKSVLVLAAETAEDEKAVAHLRELDIMTFIFSDLDTFQKVLTALTDSFPKVEGKQQPRKAARNRTA